MKLANAYFMQKWPDTGKSIITNRERPSNIWTRAVYYEGLMALYSIDPKPEFYDYAVSWGEEHRWGLRDGYVATRNGDNQCCGQTYIDLYNIEQQEERIIDIKASVDSMMATDKIDDWDWIDALQMAMPVFAKLTALTGDTAYSERMYAMYMDTKVRQGLWNPNDRLWWRDKDFLPPYKEPNGEDCYWSRGNGWVVAALVRVLDILPDDRHRTEYEETLLAMLDALVPLQREDGFWNVSLHDSENFGGKETSGTALFVYGMAWAVNNGLVESEKFEPVIFKAWNAIIKEALHKDGFLGYVQGTGKQPSDGQPVTYTSMPDFEDYGLGCFLLAGSEVFKMVQ
ncbi:glycoside hydrolase family 88 protein [Maribellus sp. YY47]|uniref:glycoside hydrolase family 88/105 protein n=1 Tax=Maribellus sp. YY47 TaxID=2929486 RepID=UPI0020012E26|nr:glycoside hydrolase family 88 protein [Maribellus sp. YY47]MCK3684174.1 glycoside hydrolase family 88 protein [Maribellus sp. YY47]